MDPNKDGYVSKTTAGFSGTNDEGAAYSEIPYRPFPAMMSEPLSDLNSGSSGGHTDLATSQYTGTTGSPIAAYFDGTNLLFRVRIGGQSTASKGYSILIDINNTFNGTGENPGFEYEVLLASNFDVRVIKHTVTNNVNTQQTIFSGSIDQYFQKAIAATTAGGDADYFYDFYVPLTAFQGGITSATPLRMSGITVTSAQSGISGTVSDVGGVNDLVYSNNKLIIWKDVISTFPPTSISQLQTGGFSTLVSAPPVVSSPIKTGSISGTSSEPAGSSVAVYRNGTLLGTTTVSSTGTWTYATNVLVAGDLITAKVTATGKSISVESNTVTVTAATVTCSGTAAPILTSTTNGGKTLTGTSSYNGSVTIRLYIPNTTTVVLTQTVTVSGGTFSVDITGLAAGTYAATQQPAGMCESLKSNEFCSNGNGNTSTPYQAYPTITSITYADGTVNTTAGNTEIATKLTTVAGTVSALTTGAVVYIYKNGIRQTAFSATLSGTTWTINVSSLTLIAGDFITARISSSGSDGNTSCSLTSSPSAIKTAVDYTTTPLITGMYCVATGSTVNSVSGTTTGSSGASIQLYNAATNTAIGSPAIINQYKSWTVSGLSLAIGTSFYAKATTSGKLQSPASASVTVTAKTTGTGLSITSPIVEGATSMSGGAPAGVLVKVYVAGSYLTSTTATAAGSWSVSGLSPYELFAGASVTITATSGTNCESTPSAAVTVQCKPFNTAIVPTLSAPKYCPNTAATVLLPTSEAGVIYNLYNGTGTSGTSVLGTGNAISLTSAALTVDPTTLTVKALKVGAPCNQQIGSNLTTSLYPALPKTYSLSASVMSGCPPLSTVITVKAAEAGYSYQLFNKTSNTAIGTLIVPTANGDLSLPAVTVSVTTDFNVIIKRTGEPCEAQNIDPTTTNIKITVTGANVAGAVTATAPIICIGTATNINFETQGGYTYKVFLKTNLNQPIGTYEAPGNSNATKSVSTGNLTTAGTYTYTVQVSPTTAATSTCPPIYMLQEATIKVSSGADVTSNAGPNQTVCGATTTLAGNDPAPGTGLWTMVSGPSTATFGSATSSSTSVSGLVSGTYQFTWTVTNACSGNKAASTVTIVVNCPALYNVAGPKNYNAYSNNEVLATVTDQDGGVTAAQLVSGRMPTGTTLNTITGAIKVDNTKGQLLIGIYTFSVRTTDARGFTTTSPVTLRFNDPNSSVVPLPVELAFFTAIRQNGSIMLQWLTATEKDNLKFVVERSLNGTDFKAIGEVAGNGTSSQPLKYSFEDKTMLPQQVYYRLKQVDYSGVATLSKIISVTTAKVTAAALKAYPNPVQTNLNVLIAAETGEAAKILLLDLRGVVVLQKAISLERGLNELELPLASLSSGVYVLKMVGEKTELSVKVMKTN